MSELRVTVDHLRLNYNGPFDANALYHLITSFTKEKGFDIELTKEFEHDTARGKQIEWVLKPWKRMSDNVRFIIKVRVLIYDYKKSDVVIQGKKKKLGSGKAVITMDGYTELDEQKRWEAFPMMQAIRAVFINFVNRIYTERFEQRLTYDVYQLYYHLEKFFNMYTAYAPVSKAPAWASSQYSYHG